MKIKIIETNEEYREALKALEDLVSRDPDPDSEEGEKLALLATLIKEYESVTFPDNLPDPVDAIIFRMEQLDLKPADLVRYFGSRSKVSEILSRKRSLTLPMIRSLESGLGIPAKVLIRESSEIKDDEGGVVWNRFPLQEMAKRGYFGRKLLDESNVDATMEKFFQEVGSPYQFVGMLRKTSYIRSLRSEDKSALIAWSGFIVKQGKKLQYKANFSKKSVDLEFMKGVARISSLPNGPTKVRDYLMEHGIGLVIEPHFPKTYLDGAVIFTDEHHPVIGLTLRYDRLDNFWFTLMHEVAHISLHSDQSTNLFFDDLDRPDTSDVREVEADRLAREALVPESIWEKSPARLVPSPLAAHSLARELGINSAIVAGFMRHENDRYRFLNSLIGQGEVRKHFPEIIDWK